MAQEKVVTYVLFSTIYKIGNATNDILFGIRLSPNDGFENERLSVMRIKEKIYHTTALNNGDR
ncbi:hypothetical protein GCM10011520_36840 [Shewanella carassii]|uniref:Uncharacterized protein n=1 Tax=Shewanella carassii TaxID=1987584 RepID=A0ABQ1TEX2_9GAMM|nr:hypothetical protein GCM10011520_36840 [Shewanella carassii]